MSFTPYSVYDARMPKLKPGFFLHIAGKFYQIMAVRNNRQFVDLALAYTEGAPLVLNITTLAAYAALHGNLTVGRVTQIQYFAFTTGIDVLLRWGTEPLLSKWVTVTIDSAGAGLTNPLQIDRWSYDPEMRLAIVKVIGAQILWLELIEYEVVPWMKTPPKKYLKILASGHAVFVEAR